MKTILLTILLLATISVNAQKSSISIKTGLTNSSVNDYLDPNYNDTINTSSLSFLELGVGYTYKIKSWLWVSMEPGLKVAGYKINDFNNYQIKSGIYFNSPIIATFNMGAKKTIVAIDLGYNPNIYITGGDAPKNYSEILFGIRAGYRISERISLEAYYRYGESLKHFYANQVLTTNYISLQTKIFLNKQKELVDKK